MYYVDFKCSKMETKRTKKKVWKARNNSSIWDITRSKKQRRLASWQKWRCQDCHQASFLSVCGFFSVWLWVFSLSLWGFLCVSVGFCLCVCGFFLSLCLRGFLCVSVGFSLSLCLRFFLSLWVFSVCVSVGFSLCVCGFLSVCLWVFPLSLCLWGFLCVSVGFFVCVCGVFCLCGFFSVCLWVFLSLCLWGFLCVCGFFFVSVGFSLCVCGVFCLCVCGVFSVCLWVFSSVSVKFCLSLCHFPCVVFSALCPWVFLCLCICVWCLNGKSGKEGRNLVGLKKNKKITPSQPGWLYQGKKSQDHAAVFMMKNSKAVLVKFTHSVSFRTDRPHAASHARGALQEDDTHYTSFLM